MFSIISGKWKVLLSHAAKAPRRRREDTGLHFAMLEPLLIS